MKRHPIITAIDCSISLKKVPTRDKRMLEQIRLDERADISRPEQVSIILRFVDEEFLGFYETKNSKA